MTHKPRQARYDDNDRYDDRPRRNRNNGMFSAVTEQIDRIPLEYLLGIGSLAMMASATTGHSVVNYLAAVLWMAFCATFLILQDKSIDSRESNIGKFVQKHGKIGIWSVLFGVFALTSLSLVMADASHAVFMSAAEAYAIANFAAPSANVAAITTVVNMIFGSLRVLIIIALAVGIYKVIAARDDSEDMKAQARLPMIIFISVAVFDVMSGLIITP